MKNATSTDTDHVCPKCHKTFRLHRGSFKAHVKWCGTEAERFWSKVEKTDGCWLWKGAVMWSPSGADYGAFGLHGKARRAHRVAWLLTHGSDPGAMDVLHSCDTPLCVNPAHLSLGTHKDNMDDMNAKGRNGSTGEKSKWAKLTEDDVRRIRALKGIKKQREIADEYGLHLTYVSQIWCRKSWKHI